MAGGDIEHGFGKPFGVVPDPPSGRWSGAFLGKKIAFHHPCAEFFEFRAVHRDGLRPLRLIALLRRREIVAVLTIT